MRAFAARCDREGKRRSVSPSAREPRDAGPSGLARVFLPDRSSSPLDNGCRETERRPASPKAAGDSHLRFHRTRLAALRSGHRRGYPGCDRPTGTIPIDGPTHPGATTRRPSRTYQITIPGCLSSWRSDSHSHNLSRLSIVSIRFGITNWVGAGVTAWFTYLCQSVTFPTTSGYLRQQPFCEILTNYEDRH